MRIRVDPEGLPESSRGWSEAEPPDTLTGTSPGRGGRIYATNPCDISKGAIGRIMMAINPTQGLQWLGEHGFLNSAESASDEIFGMLPPSGFQAIKMNLPRDSGKKVALAKLIVRRFDPNESLLVWIGNWVVWPSSGHIPLLMRLRQAFGENRPLEAAPVHVFSSAEREDAVSFLILSLEFFWDLLIVESTGTLSFFVSHDEFLQVMAKDGTALTEINDRLIRFLKM
jgi:hypothetical protein